MHVDCTMLTPIDSYSMMLFSIESLSACASAKQKQHDESYFGSCSYVCWKRKELSHLNHAVYMRPNCRLSSVARLWQRPSLNLSHCTTQDHWLGERLFHDAECVSGFRFLPFAPAQSCLIRVLFLYDSGSIEIKIISLNGKSASEWMIFMVIKYFAKRICLNHLLYCHWKYLMNDLWMHNV